MSRAPARDALAPAALSEPVEEVPPAHREAVPGGHPGTIVHTCSLAHMYISFVQDGMLSFLQACSRAGILFVG